ncbi:MAG TPA: FKBP-type peptidyl-prolyl cis-trans isomerase [Pseudomonadales bacterium]
MHDEKPYQAGPPARLETGIRTALAVLLLGLAGACDGAGEATSRTPAGGEGTEPPAAQAPVAAGSALTDDAAKASYSLGYRFAENVQRQFPGSIRQDAFLDGVRDQLAGEAARVDDAEAERVLTALMEQRQAEADHRALRNLEEGLAFLEKNSQREGVVTLESGLQYEVLQPGQGEKPKPTDVVTTHYEGRLIDGTVFDSSYQRGEPASFPLNRVIAGWTEGLQLMSPGAKYRLFVPSELAYGERGAGQVIPPNATLIFDVELLEIAPEDDEGADEPDPAQ